MRITATGPQTAAAPVASTAPAVEATAPVAAVAPVRAAGLQSAALQPAMAAMQALPEIDAAKVEALRDALARGEVRFDAKRLAGLIERYHGAGR
ncbi:flagellar biosynthesis anti-sigma factor FlgM [Aquabacterium sp. A7-Y]|uniref:flagellar biosynthesis anti-sigma factor FlgM n=1 Tax=Aquabacterium sp. A7-Y TaxID=1349605 RepID=UPI00223D68EB|nr:flagellar biosynthesis anti-sigma factor FlgM [Aquabacterium sp. A7-Y]MCW7536531.1 flagellar biosynthesis anti-sigma factor FlgM [Aquabacterium sp. A7-Y]